MEAHRDILRSAVLRHGGAVFGAEGDATFSVFTVARDAVAAAEDAQRTMTAHPWPEAGAVRVRMAVHTGDVRRVGDAYYGMSLHEAARVCAAGHGGQVLLTGAARDAAHDCDVRDLGDHRLKDLAEPVPILQLLAVGLVESFPPLRTLSSRPNNLPAGTDEFVGRTVELAAVVDAFAAHRLVTLTGTGGSGKTRLSLEAAGRLLSSVRDGAWFVELAPLTDPTLITAQVAVVLGLGETAGKPLRGDADRVAARSRGAARPGQLRAPRGGGGRVRRPSARLVPEAPHPGHKSRGARNQRRTCPACAATGP